MNGFLSKSHENEVLLHAFLDLLVKEGYFLLNDIAIDLLTLKMNLNS